MLDAFPPIIVADKNMVVGFNFGAYLISFESTITDSI